MKFTAIILARNSSSRFRGKHFKQIGNKYVIEHTIKCLIDNENISEVYIATGPFKKNNILKCFIIPFEDIPYSFKNNVYVKPKRPILNIPNIKSNSSFHIM